MAEYQLSAIEDHYKFEPAFTKWWAWFRVRRHLDTVPYHLELSARIAALEAWIAAKKRRGTTKRRKS